MSELLQLVNSDLGKQIIENISQKVGTTPSQTSSILATALPQLVNALQSNTTQDDTAKGLLNALISGKHNETIDNIQGFLNNSTSATEGNKILGKILGNNQQSLENNLSLTSGLPADKIGSILQMAAPLLMSFLSNKAKQGNVQNTTDLGGLLSGLLSGVGGNTVLTSMLDQDGDGKLSINDAVSAVSKKGGLGGLLGNLFGK